MIVARKPGILVARNRDGRIGLVVHRHNTSSDTVYVRLHDGRSASATANWLRTECTFRFLAQ